MTPYRVIVDTPSGKQILSAMISVDAKTGQRNIYIVNKGNSSFPDSIKLSEAKAVAHTQTSKKNSSILCSYLITKQSHRQYAIQKVYFKNASGSCVYLDTKMREYTQYDCLKAAMHDYCSVNKFNIIQNL